MDFLELVCRSVFSIAILFVITKLMGYRQISQLTFYDYIIGITIGSISADMATELETDLWNTVIPILVYGGISILISFVTNKSIRLRRFLTGVPVVLIQHGEIIKKNLQKVHYDINDLLGECRSAGYFDINDLDYVIMEHTGKISFLPNVSKRPCTPEDLNLSPEQEGLVVNLIMDGEIMEEHLKKIGKERKWLDKQLEEQGIKNPKAVLLATYDINGNFHVFLQTTSKEIFDVLE